MKRKAALTQTVEKNFTALPQGLVHHYKKLADQTQKSFAKAEAKLAKAKASLEKLEQKQQKLQAKGKRIKKSASKALINTVKKLEAECAIHKGQLAAQASNAKKWSTLHKLIVEFEKNWKKENAAKAAKPKAAKTPEKIAASAPRVITPAPIVQENREIDLQ